MALSSLASPSSSEVSEARPLPLDPGINVADWPLVARWPPICDGAAPAPRGRRINALGNLGGLPAYTGTACSSRSVSGGQLST
jgi:hypothetical protein